MRISTAKVEVPTAESITITHDTLSVDLSDGRTISVPLAWFPRLLHASPKERDNWRFIGKGHGIHWEELDEDISVENLPVGKPSDESQRSFNKWLMEDRLALQSAPADALKRAPELFRCALCVQRFVECGSAHED